MSVGKTIARIEERPTDPEYRYARDDTLVIHFTDGTAMIVSGHSHEEVSLDWREADPDELRRWARAAGGRRERERLCRLERDAWDALSDDERAAKTAARRAKMSPMARAMEDEMVGMAKSVVFDINRGFFGSIPRFPVEKSQQRGKARRS